MEAACILYNYSHLEEEEEEGIGGKERETHDYLPGRSL
jgi:hypothetical protein